MVFFFIILDLLIFVRGNLPFYIRALTLSLILKNVNRKLRKGLDGGARESSNCSNERLL